MALFPQLEDHPAVDLALDTPRKWGKSVGVCPPSAQRLGEFGSMGVCGFLIVIVIVVAIACRGVARRRPVIDSGGWVETDKDYDKDYD